MILEFSINNFYSFKEENSVSFIVNKKSPCTDAYVTTENGTRITKILACFGANASGKTNLLKALSFLSWFTYKSFDLKPDEKIPIQPFRFENDNAVISSLSVDFIQMGNIYRYVVKLSPDQIFSESLYIRSSKGFKYLFKRHWNEDKKLFDFSTKNFGLPGSFADSLNMRKNASTISLALQHNHAESKNIAEFWSKISTNVREQGRDGHLDVGEVFYHIFKTAEYFHKHIDYKIKAEELLTRFDLGLSGLEIEEREVGIDQSGKPEKIIFPFGIHIGRDKSTHKLPLFYESSGTQNLFIVLRKILPILQEKNGGIAVLDEFEVDLHPHMIPALLDLFISKKTNPYNAQLIFSCHSIELMKKLDKYQVLLVEKDEYGYSRVIRLDEIRGVRSDDNIYAKYDAGAYGAVPNI